VRKDSSVLTVCPESLHNSVKIELEVLDEVHPLSGRMSWFEIKQQGRTVWSYTQVGTAAAAAKCENGMAMMYTSARHQKLRTKRLAHSKSLAHRSPVQSGNLSRSCSEKELLQAWFLGVCPRAAMVSLLYKGGVCELPAKNAFRQRGTH
jgi:hypothetical protein